MAQPISHDFLKRWNRVERDHFGLGILPLAKNPNEKVHIAVFDRWDARLGESLIETHSIHPLIRLRALLFRGRLEDAENTLSSLPSVGAATAEILLEQTRLYGFQGMWSQVLESANRGLALAPQPVTHLAFLQCRSVAQFELGEFGKCIEDLDRIDSLSFSIPHSNLTLYAQAIRIRIAARDRGFDSASRALDELLRRVTKELNVDVVLTLLRTEADICRVGSKDDFEAAFASFLLARAMGDLLYTHLAWIEVIQGLEFNRREALLKELRMKALKFPRVLSLLDEIQGKGSTTSGSMIVAGGNHSNLRNELVLPESFDQLAWVRAKAIVSLPKLEIETFASEQKSFTTLQCLGNSEISKDEFFRRHWKLQNFVPRLHDGNVRTQLSRARSKLNVSINSTGGVLSLPQCWIVSHHE